MNPASTLRIFFMQMSSKVFFDFSSCLFNEMRFCNANTINDIDPLPYMQMKNPNALPGLVLG